MGQIASASLSGRPIDWVGYKGAVVAVAEGFVVFKTHSPVLP